MEIDKLKAVMNWMAASSLAELELTDGDMRIRLVKDAGGAVRPANAIQPTPTHAVVAPVGPQDVRSTVCAPIFGVVHLSSAPGEPDFVNVGQAVKSGDTLCVIEAMKVFTAVDAPQDGIVVDVQVEAGSEVAMGQPLFAIEARPR